MASSCLNLVMAIDNLEITANPNWLELPRDITVNILQRLGTLENICRYAVDRSCGHLKDIYIKKFGTNDLLIHIAKSASHLRSIRLERCYAISTADFLEVVKNMLFLEELDICHCLHDLQPDFFEVIGQSCPLLKSLKLSPSIEVVDDKSDNEAFAIAKTMPMLRHLTILNNGLTNNGLLTILDGCPLLESLDIRGCLHLDFDGSLNERCKQVKEIRFPSDIMDYKYNFEDFMIHFHMGMERAFDNFDISIVDKLKEIEIY